MPTVGALCAVVVIMFLFFSSSGDREDSAASCGQHVDHSMDYDPDADIPKILHQVTAPDPRGRFHKVQHGAGFVL